MTKSEAKSMWTRVAGGLTAVATGLVMVGVTPDVALAQESNSQNVSGNIGFDLSHAYFFRGITQERSGAVTQPYADLGWSLWSNDDGPIHSVDVQIGMWNSLHTGPTGSQEGGAATHVRSWYESDFFAGFTMGFDNWEAGVTYTSYMSPNATFSTVKEMAFSLGMDDSALFGRFSMNPHVTMAVELDGQADGGTSEGVYLEVGVEPGMDIVNGAASISFPVTFGFSMSNYYENKDLGFESKFGYFDIGADIAFPLSVFPAGYGDWELSGGFHLLSLGEYLEALNDGDSAQPVATFGVNVAF